MTGSDADVETLTLTISTEDGREDTLTVPAGLVEAMSEPGDDPPRVIGDLAMLQVANRAHHMVHHHEGEADPELEAQEARAMELFEERFGVSFAEATGHGH